MTPVFVVTLEGLEAPAGPRLTVLAFATAANEDAARRLAEAEVAALGWTDVETLRAGEVTDRDALPADFADAYATAERHGCGLIVYDEA